MHFATLVCYFATFRCHPDLRSRLNSDEGVGDDRTVEVRLAEVRLLVHFATLVCYFATFLVKMAPEMKATDPSYAPDNQFRNGLFSRLRCLPRSSAFLIFAEKRPRCSEAVEAKEAANRKTSASR